jgi:hypothetical protein
MNGTIQSPLVVLEATGPVGAGVVAAALAARRPVIAVDSDAAALRRLTRAHAAAALTGLQGSARDEAAAAALAADLRALDRPLGGVVAALDGGLLRGRLLDLPVDASCRRFEAALAPQLSAARHLLPLLAEAGRGGYVLIGGPGAEHPWAGYGHPSVIEAALRMLARVLHGEARALGVRLQLLSVDTPSWGVHAGLPRADWPSALDVGQRALELLAPGAPADAVVEFRARGSTPSAPAFNRPLNPTNSATDAARDAPAAAGSALNPSYHEASS